MRVFGRVIHWDPGLHPDLCPRLLGLSQICPAKETAISSKSTALATVASRYLTKAARTARQSRPRYLSGSLGCLYRTQFMRTARAARRCRLRTTSGANARSPEATTHLNAFLARWIQSDCFFEDNAIYAPLLASHSVARGGKPTARLTPPGIGTETLRPSWSPDLTVEPAPLAAPTTSTRPSGS